MRSIMVTAIADVFDTVSQNRYYRAAMPLEKCFKIIEEGRVNIKIVLF